MPACKSFSLSSFSSSPTSNQSPNPMFILTVSSSSFTLPLPFSCPQPLLPRPQPPQTATLHLPLGHHGSCVTLLSLEFPNISPHAQYAARLNELLVPTMGHILSLLYSFEQNLHLLNPNLKDPLKTTWLCPFHLKWLAWFSPLKPIKQVSHKVAT